MKVEFRYVTEPTTKKNMPALCIETPELFKARVDEQELVSFKTAADVFMFSYGLDKKLTREECMDIINRATIDDSVLIMTVVLKNGEPSVQMLYAKQKKEPEI